jgi:N utilization substance protein B
VARDRRSNDGVKKRSAVTQQKTYMTPASRPPATAKPGTRKSASKSARSRAREFALQALYQHFVGGSDVALIDAFTRELQGFGKADAAHYDALLHGCIELKDDLDALITPLLDRPLGQISSIEHGCMWIGAYELLKCPDVPWRVALNECIELAKDFGGTDGYKYVNAVLNGLAPKLRSREVEVDRDNAAQAKNKR